MSRIVSLSSSGTSEREKSSIDAAAECVYPLAAVDLTRTVDRGRSRIVPVAGVVNPFAAVEKTKTGEREMSSVREREKSRNDAVAGSATPFAAIGLIKRERSGTDGRFGCVDSLEAVELVSSVELEKGSTDDVIGMINSVAAAGESRIDVVSAVVDHLAAVEKSKIDAVFVFANPFATVKILEHDLTTALLRRC